MIQNVDPHHHACRHQPFGQTRVLDARFRISRGVIVEQHNRGSAGRHRLPENLARMDDAGVERADGEHGTAEHAVFRVEQQDAELLDATIAILRQQKFGDHAGARHLRSGAGGIRHRAPSQLDGREQLRGTRRADPADALQLVAAHTRQPRDAADRRKRVVGEIERATPGLTLTEQDRDQFVVAERGRTETSELFTRSIVLSDGLHRTPSLLYCRSMRRLAAAIGTLVFLTACSEPPQKEIDRAQGAIDAARAAGAEQYAPDPFTAATTAMQQTHEAVDQRDYRLALSRAVDANERALEAARQAADGKARVRGVAEGTIGRALTAERQLNEQIKVADSARVPARDLEPARRVYADAQRSLQEARAAMAAGNYLVASNQVEGLPEKIAAQTREVSQLVEKRGKGRRR